MSSPVVVFDRVWKKFRRGERHDSLRDAVTELFKRPFTRPRNSDLDSQEFWVLSDVSFQVKPGEALGIIGPNGAGKSTALKLLTRILKPNLGSCYVRGRVGALIEVSSGFHPDLTGRENLYLQGAILGMTRQEVSKKLDAIVDFSGVGDFIDTQVKRYSSGMNARLGFAVAAHVDPDVLIIDEVLAVGDFAFQQKCYERLGEFRRSGAAIVLVSHNMQAIVSLCDRALLLRPGQRPVLSSVGEVAALYSSPSGTAVDPRLSILSCRLAERGQEGDVSETVEPGSSLTLETAFQVHSDLPQTRIDFEITRSDGMVMFTGSPMVEGAAMLDLKPGMVCSVKVDFRANVLRGIYRVNLRLSERNRLWLPIELAGVSSFVVHETTRVGGCAELEPVYQLSVMQQPAAAEPLRVRG